MRITEAAAELGMSPRMLRYRERLGLVPNGRASDVGESTAREHRTSRQRPGRRRSTPTAHRRYTAADIATIRFALRLETEYDISPSALAFALRVLAEPDVAARVRELGERLGRIPTPAERAAELERERALRWLGRSGMLPPPRPTRRYR
ncbi:MAG TPA: MerR family transcriptional regulator [Actinopolymorphaceae bacterium]|jgi:DNA-binding transcriptional MerR regulator